MTIIFIMIMLMQAIHTFFEPVWVRLMEIISGDEVGPRTRPVGRRVIDASLHKL